MRCHYTNAGDLKDPMPGVYPTREQILEEPGPLLKMGLFQAISQWKAADYGGWSEMDDSAKFDALERLIGAVCRVYEVKPPVLDQWGRVSGYVDGMIGLSSMSILTTLHELGHHLLGPSEYHACRFSVWLYQRMFKSAYGKLTWMKTPGMEHMLVMPSSSKSAIAV